MHKGRACSLAMQVGSLVARERTRSEELPNEAARESSLKDRLVRFVHQINREVDRHLSIDNGRSNKCL